MAADIKNYLKEKKNGKRIRMTIRKRSVNIN